MRVQSSTLGANVFKQLSKTRAELAAKLTNRLPSRYKNPRKLKKLWKQHIHRNLAETIMVGFQFGRARLHWVPGQSWTVTVTRNPRQYAGYKLEMDRLKKEREEYNKALT